MARGKKAAAEAAPVATASAPAIDLSRAPSRTQVALAEFIQETTGYTPDVQTVRLTLLLTKAFRNSPEQVERRETRKYERENHAELVAQRRQERLEARARKLEEKAAAIRNGVSTGAASSDHVHETPAPVVDDAEPNPFADDDDF